MPKHARNLSCEEFQRNLIEKANSGAALQHLQRRPHVKACATCRQRVQVLVQELELIVNAARSLFPENDDVK